MRRFLNRWYTLPLTAAFLLLFIVGIPAHWQIQPATPSPNTTVAGAATNSIVPHPSSDNHLCTNYKPDGTVTNS